MDELKINDEYDGIIIGMLLIEYSNFPNYFPNYLGGLDEEGIERLDELQTYGVNEIARLVEKFMAYKTALNHINKLIKEGYLIDINSLIVEKLEEIEPPYNINKQYPYNIVMMFVYEELEKLQEKYKSEKKRLTPNWKKILDSKTSTS